MCCSIPKSQNAHLSYTGPSLSSNTTYYWRVTVYDSQDRSSGWVNGTSFATAIHPFPNADFNWSPTSPTKEDAVLFSDTTIFHTGSRNQSWFWSIPGATYLASTNDSTQNPQVRFKAKGTYLVSLGNSRSSYPGV